MEEVRCPHRVRMDQFNGVCDRRKQKKLTQKEAPWDFHDAGALFGCPGRGGRILEVLQVKNLYHSARARVMWIKPKRTVPFAINGYLRLTEFRAEREKILR